MIYSITMGKNKKGTTECAPQSNQNQGSLVEEQPKKKKLRTGTSIDCSDFKDSTATKLIAKAISHVVEDKLNEEERKVFERKLKKERKKEQRTVNLECAVGIKKVEPKLLVEEELTAEERRKLRKELEREERKLKKKHPTDLKEAEPEFSLEEEPTTEERRVVERKLKKEQKKEEKKSKKECLAKNKKAKSELFLEEELTAEERRVFERKLKKERKKEQRKLKQECPTDLKEVAPQKPSGCELALQYLNSWSQKTEDWKFQKTRQTWLLLHMYDPEKVPGSHFIILLDYLEGLRGSARDLTVRKAEALIKEHENADTEDNSLLELMERARQVIQLLS